MNIYRLVFRRSGTDQWQEVSTVVYRDLRIAKGQRTRLANLQDTYGSGLPGLKYHYALQVAAVGDWVTAI